MAIYILLRNSKVDTSRFFSVSLRSLLFSNCQLAIFLLSKYIFLRIKVVVLLLKISRGTTIAAELG